MQIAQDFLSRAPAENPAHSGLCKGFSTGAVGRKDKQDVQVIFEQFLRRVFRLNRHTGSTGCHVSHDGRAGISFSPIHSIIAEAAWRL